jgi:hypothetical protein
MSTSKDPEPNSLTCDDIIHTNPLLFRLHSPKFSHTFFHDDSKILFASRSWKKDSNSEDILATLKALKEKPISYDPSAVARHIASWSEGSAKPSDFISLTYNFWYVLWEWKRRRHQQQLWCQSNVPEPEDDFQVIIFKSSELKGRAKLGVEVVNETKNPRAYSFTRAHHEVIVADFIQPPAIVGVMPLSQLQGFIPSWCREQLQSVENVPGSKAREPSSFKVFAQNLRESKKNFSAKEVDGALQSLRFALELLAPILAGSEHWHQRANNEGTVDSANRDRPRDQGSPLDRSSHGTTHAGGLLAGAAEGSPSAARPPKRRKLAEPEEQRGVQDITESANADQGGNDPERLRVCNYIRAMLADIWYMEEMGGRRTLLETGTDDVDELLKRYLKTIEKYVHHAC